MLNKLFEEGWRKGSSACVSAKRTKDMLSVRKELVLRVLNDLQGAFPPLVQTIKY